MNRKSAEKGRYVHANVQSQIQLSGLMYAQLMTKFYLNKKIAATLKEQIEFYLFFFCVGIAECPLKSMLFLFILFIFLPFALNKSHCQWNI